MVTKRRVAAIARDRALAGVEGPPVVQRGCRPQRLHRRAVHRGVVGPRSVWMGVVLDDPVSRQAEHGADLAGAVKAYRWGAHGVA